MKYPESFAVSTPTDCEIVISRDFDAPLDLVFAAFTKPELIQRWLFGPEGWSMPICEVDLRVGGSYRYVWRKAGVQDMGMGGKFKQIEQPTLLVTTERFDDSWYPGEALNTTEFTASGNRTTVRITVRYESKEARETAACSGMADGMAIGYDRLEAVLANLSGN